VYSELTAEIADAIAHLGWLNKLPDHIVFCNADNWSSARIK